MFVYFVYVMNVLFVFFYLFFFSFGIYFFFILLYLVVCWVFFLSYLFGFVLDVSLVCLFYDFTVLFYLDSISIFFLLLILCVFSVWFVYISYFGSSIFLCFDSFSCFFCLLHSSIVLLLVGNFAFYMVLLEFLTVPVAFLFFTQRGSDWLVGLSLLLFYSSFTGLCCLFSFNSLSSSDWLVCFISYCDSWSVFLVFVSLLVKSSGFPFHSWLPYAHGLCSTMGSVFLAGVYLKLGAYGLVSFFFFLDFYSFFSIYLFLFIILSFFGVVFGVFGCLFQLDFKKFVAFSSVVHMNFSLLVFYLGGFKVSLYIWFSHGMVTSLFFFLLGFVYSSTGTKLLVCLGNLSFASIWYVVFVFCLLFDVGFPVFLSFVSEVSCFFVYLLQWSFFFSFVLFFVYFFFCFSFLSLFIYVSFGFSSVYFFDLSLVFVYLFSSFSFFYLYVSFFFPFFFLC